MWIFISLILCFKHSLFPSGHEESGDPFHTSLLYSWWGWEGKLVNRTECIPWGRYTKGPNLPRKVCATGVMAQSKSDFSAIVSKLCLISQTLLLFHSWLPLPCFIDAVFPIAHVQNRLLVLFLFFLFCFGVFLYFLLVFVIPLESAVSFLSPRWSVGSCSQSPVIITDALLTSPSR